jgi:uncharacterized protein HemY
MLLPTMVSKFCSLLNEYNATRILSRAVRRAYRKRALETHPDKLDPGANDKEKEEAERQFHRVTNPIVYEIPRQILSGDDKFYRSMRRLKSLRIP